MMNKIVGIIAFVFLVYQNLYGQKMPSDYFEEGEKFVESQDYKNAISSFQFIVKNNPKNSLFARAYYNVGYLYFVNKQYDSSIIIFKSILKSDFNEKEPYGGGIMDRPYANFRNEACVLLSDIYYNTKMYDSALYYFSLSDTLYPSFSICGNAYNSNKLYYALKYADIYLKLRNKNKAIESLLTVVFVYRKNTTEVVKQLKKLLKRKRNLKKELDFALNNIYSKSYQGEDYNYQVFYIKFLNTEIEIPECFDELKNLDKEKTIQKIKESQFYKMINEL